MVWTQAGLLRPGLSTHLIRPGVRGREDVERVVDLRGADHGRPLLIIHSSDDMYGADRMVLEVVGALSDADRARVVVWLPTDYEHGATPLCEELKARGIDYEHVALPILRRRYLNAAGMSAMGGRALETRKRLAALNPSDIVLATSAVLPIAPLIGRRGSTRVVLHMQEVWQGHEARVLGGLAARVDRVIAISEAARASLPDGLQERAVVVPNGTSEPDEYLPLDPKAGELVFVTASRWNAWKGHEVLIKAWDQAGCPGRLIILGGPPSMGSSVDVPAMVSASRRPVSIDVRGEVSDAGAIISEADVMVVPSTSPEPFGLVSIEAFARGRPVIASANGGLLEIVRDGSGWLVPPGDVTALAEQLGELTRSATVAAGHAARRRYEQHYSQASFRAAWAAAFAPEGVERAVEANVGSVASSLA